MTGQQAQCIARHRLADWPGYHAGVLFSVAVVQFNRAQAPALHLPERGPKGITPSLTRWVFLRLLAGFTGSAFGQVAYRLPTSAPKKKPCYLFNSRVSMYHLGWLMGLEPTTTGITILSL